MTKLLTSPKWFNFPQNNRKVISGFFTRFQSTLKIFYKADFDHRYALLIKPVVMLLTLIMGVGLAFIMVHVSKGLPFLVIVLIPIAIIAMKYPHVAVLFVVFLIPFEAFAGGGEFSPLKMASLGALGLSTIHFFVFRSGESLVSARQNWLILIFILVVYLSNFVAMDLERTFGRSFRLITVISLYFLVINMIRSETHLRQLLWVYIISGVLSCIYGLYAYYIDNSLLNAQHAIPRMIGTMDDPNEFGGAMITRLMLAVVLLEIEGENWKRGVLAVFIGILLFSVVLTGSRGALLATALAFIIFVLFQENKTFWFILLSIAAVLGLIFMPQSIKERVGLAESTTGENLGNDTERRESYQIVGFGLFLENPILGIGFDSFAEGYARSEYRFLQTNRTRRLAHNTYMEIMAGTGTLGLISFFSLLGTSFANVVKCAYHKKRYPFLGGVAVGLLGSKIGFFFIALFLSQQYEKTLWFLLAMVVVLQTLIQDKKDAEREAARRSQKFMVRPQPIAISSSS